MKTCPKSPKPGCSPRDLATAGTSRLKKTKDSTMDVRFTLSDAAFETLRAFCAENLKADLDATSYAEGLVSEYDNWDGDVIFEIRGFHTASGNPATIRFDHSTDFDYCDLDA